MPTQTYRTRDGKRVKGVTTIFNVLNKPGLLFWAYAQGLENFNRITEAISKECNLDDHTDMTLRESIVKILRDFKVGELYEKRDKAATAGTLGHLYVEHHLKKIPDPSLSKFWEDYPGTPHKDRKAIEKKGEGCYIAYLEWEKTHLFEMIHSELSLVSEEYKFGGTIDIGAIVGEMGIVDIKTSKGIFIGMLAQVAAYKELYNEIHPEAPIKGLHIVRLGEEGDFEHKYWPELNYYWEIFLHCLGIQNLLDKMGKKL